MDDIEVRIPVIPLEEAEGFTLKFSILLAFIVNVWLAPVPEETKRINAFPVPPAPVISMFLKLLLLIVNAPVEGPALL